MFNYRVIVIVVSITRVLQMKVVIELSVGVISWLNVNASTAQDNISFQIVLGLTPPQGLTKNFLCSLRSPIVFYNLPLLHFRYGLPQPRIYIQRPPPSTWSHYISYSYHPCIAWPFTNINPYLTYGKSCAVYSKSNIRCPSPLF